MSVIDSLGPTQRRALLAALHSPARSLTRSAGGWWIAIAPDGKASTFTVRTVRMLARGWLLDLQGEFATTAPLTTKGVTVAHQLQALMQPQAGAA